MTRIALTARIAGLVAGSVLILQAAAGLADVSGTGIGEAAGRLSAVARIPGLDGYTVFVDASLLVAGIAVATAAVRLAGRSGAGPQRSSGIAGAEEGAAMEPEAPNPGGATVVAPGTGVRVLMWGGFPLAGAGLGALLRSLVDWLATWPWVPMEGPVRLISALPDLPTRIGGAAVGLVAGLAVAFIGEGESATVTVDDDTATIDRGGRRTAFARTQVRAVFMDGTRLVALGHDTEEVAGRPADLDGRRLAAAFRAHGYPWHDGGDPHAAEYRRWVEGHRELSAGAHALLAARERALRKDGSDADADAEELRAQLADLGVVVRDERTKQYWRAVPLRGGADGTGRG
ncbi:YqeB family protein [Streptomonospora salina]|uniref:Uncharacterized protein n=1 Tax=Streptomonospora salina TaxID=104205 RepID=A0A841E570_9ACTN|nr:hypothetical protein [Streptomonospora salina]MBB5998285.1 hypothetical protein [Streptomonospora salina]